MIKILNKQEQKLQMLIDEHVAKIEPIVDKAELACWSAYTNGTDENWKKAEEMEKIWMNVYTSSDDYKKLLELQDSGEINDSLLKRQLHILVKAYKRNQMPEKILSKIIAKSSEITKLRNNFRMNVDGKKLIRNDMKKVFEKSNNNEERKKVWEAQKKIGPVILEPLMDLVKLRNQAAKYLNYDNFYQMKIDLQDINLDWLIDIFDKLYETTETAYVKSKNEIDDVLKKRFGVTELMPWHYSDPFFQECPRLTNFDFNTFYAKKDIIPVVKRFYAGIGFDIEEIIAKSDLFPRDGKSEHACCFDIDKKGDTRVLMNIVNNFTNIRTLMHEVGHAVYNLNIDRTLPWLLRDSAHTLTTEAVAMMFGTLPYSGRWMQEEYGLSDADVKKIGDVGLDLKKKSRLIFSRWCQVMLRFEKSMYEDPNQDLNSLWWNLVEKYQHIKKPAGRNMPDFVSKDHIVSSPVYYHNYQLGELMASQLKIYILSNVTNGKRFNGNPEVGKYMVEKVFKSGSVLNWNDLIEYATGEKLNPKYFSEMYM